MKAWRWIPAVLAVVLLWTATGFSQQFPSRPIELVVPFGAGGGSDILARTIAKIIADEKLLPVPVVVVNKPGGSGAVGYAYLAAKKGDPYFLGTVSSSFWTTPLVGQSPVTYRDFTPLAGLAYDTFLLVTREESAYKKLSDVVAVAKKNPGLITVGGSAIASDDAVVTQMFSKEAGIELNYIVFGGSGPAVTAMLGGHISLTWANPGEALAQIEAKKVRALAVSSSTRLAGLPNVPTFKELGYGVDFQQFRGVVAPAGIPADAARVYAEAFGKLCRSKKWQTEYVAQNLITGVCLNAAEFGKAVESTNDLYKRIFTELKVIK